MSFKFNIESTPIEGVKILTPSKFEDTRGALWSAITPDLNKQLNVPHPFAHTKYASNFTNVLRGIHGDFESWKLVTVLSGYIQQVVVDNRKENDTYLQSLSWLMDAANPKMILIPPGCGNAFKSLSDSLYMYSLAYPSLYNDFDKQFTLKWDDPKFNIRWQGEQPTLSHRDE